MNVQTTAPRPGAINPAMTQKPAARKGMNPLSGMPYMLSKQIDMNLATAAEKKGSADAIVFFKTPYTNQNARAAVDALAGADLMPRGADRKQAVATALQKINNVTRETMDPKIEALVKKGAVKGVDNLWAFNAMRLRGANVEALRSLAGPNVLSIVPDEIVAYPQVPNNGFLDPVAGAALIDAKQKPRESGKPDKGGKTPGKTAPGAKAPRGVKADDNVVHIDWGVMKMNAPAAWQQGITGAGIVVGGLDTGVIPEHPGLKANFRGTKPDGTQDLNHNWFNGVEKGLDSPIDDVGHGTHTIGSVLGNDKNHIVGVAPDAKFIAARGLGEAGGNLFGLMNTMQWMIAPTDLKGKNPKPELAPDIVTNSWGGPPTSNPFLWSGLRNWRRAGLIPIFAAGNARTPLPEQVASPGLYDETITVGATGPDDKRASFSMYGPTKYANDRKPEVMGPGVKTYSTTPDGQYHDTLISNGKQYEWSGTSMATPHVAGAAALYMQAHPDATFDEIRNALIQSSTHIKEPSHEDGYGRVQVDKLIAPGTIDKGAKLTDPARVKELMDQVSRGKVWPGDPKYVPPTVTKPGVRKNVAKKAAPPRVEMPAAPGAAPATVATDVAAAF